MRLHRFIGDFPLDREEITIADKETISQIRHVLRLKRGNIIMLSDGRGAEARAQILLISKNTIHLSILDRNRNTNEPWIRGILYCAILRRENFELACQKATEIGITGIVPLRTERTIKMNTNEERLRKIIREAAEQSGRGTLPTLARPLTLPEAIEDAQQYDRNFFFHAQGEPLSTTQERFRSVGMFIGPEGGWNDQEVALAAVKGLPVTSLGSLTLRAETAAIIAPFLVLHLKIG